MKNDFKNTYSSEQKPDNSDEHDSMFGSLLFDCFCGGALGAVFAEAIDMPEWARELDASNAADLYDEYRRDRANGGFANKAKLGVNKALNGMFNRLGKHFTEPDPDFPSLPDFQLEAEGQGTFATANVPAPALW